MAGQSASMSRNEVASKINAIEKNSQSCSGKGSGTEKNSQTTGAGKSKMKKK